MGLFKRKKKKEIERDESELPKLPQISELPTLPSIKENNSKKNLPQLPIYPSTSLGQKLSQDTIKDAVTGGKEDEAEANDFHEEDHEMMSLPQIKQSPQKDFEIKLNKNPPIKKTKGPIFIRLDKFQESLKIFEEAREKIKEMEHHLSEIKSLKQKEENELNKWENEIQQMKSQTQKVERDIFSKV